MDLLWFFFCLVFLCLFACLFICALWSPAGKGLTSWLSFVVSNCGFVTFPIGILGQVWYLIVSIPDLCALTYFGWRINLAADEFYCNIQILPLYVFAVCMLRYICINVLCFL